MNHIDDLVELYALGSLDELERRRVDAHAITCATCAHALGDAEAVVTFAIEADPQYEPSLALRERLSASLDSGRVAPDARDDISLDSGRVAPDARDDISAPQDGGAWMRWAAVAAAIVVLALPAGFLGRNYMAMHATVADDTMLFEKMAGQRLASATFKPMMPAAPAAHVMYAKNGNFYAVVVPAMDHPIEVAYVHPDGTMEKVGMVERRGTSGLAVMPIDHKMPMLALVDSGSIISEARLAFN